MDRLKELIQTLKSCSFLPDPKYVKGNCVTYHIKEPRKPMMLGYLTIEVGKDWYRFMITTPGSSKKIKSEKLKLWRQDVPQELFCFIFKRIW
jgi:hypothetical protein